MPEVSCQLHGTFPYKRDICPCCDATYQAELKKAANEQLEITIAYERACKVALQELNEQYEGTHQLGKAGERYVDYKLLDAVVFCERRFARLAKSSRIYGAPPTVVCVPWIAAFAEVLEQKITVRWHSNEMIYDVNDDDGRIASREKDDPEIEEAE